MKLVKMITLIALVLSLAVYGVSEIAAFAKQDATLPMITSDRDILEVSCAEVDEQLLSGLSAYDEKDGDLTSQIVVGSATRFIAHGEYNITYAVFDASNQMATLTRRVRLTDYHSPQFTLSAPLVFDVGAAAYNTIKKYVGAVDVLEGDLSEWVVLSSDNINIQQVGSYYYTAQVSNRYGDTVQLNLPVHVIRESDYSLQIRLKEPIVYIAPGTGFDPDQWLEGLYEKNGNELDSDLVGATGSVDISTPGCYEVCYQAEANGKQGITWLTVVVQEGV